MKNFIKINPNVVKGLRESLNIDLANASKHSKLSAKRISEIESNLPEISKPTLVELKALAKAYNKSLASLLLQEVITEKPIPKDRRTVKSEEIGHFDIKTIQVIEKARALGESFIKLKTELNIPINRFSFKATLSDDPKFIATQFRKDWELSELSKQKDAQEAFEMFVEIVEKLGAFVFQLPLNKDKLRGFSITDEEIPIIVIKRGNEPVTAKIFTLFHEVGHLLLNESGMCDITFGDRQQVEKWCNAFASEILVPSDELLSNNIVMSYINRKEKVWQKSDLIKIGKVFFVGPLVILRKLYEHNLTTQKFYKEKLEMWNKPTFVRPKEHKGRQIPKEIVSEKGKTFIGLAFSAFDQNRINLKELSDYLGAKFIYIQRIRQQLYG